MCLIQNQLLKWLQQMFHFLLLCLQGQPHRLATPDEALQVQILIETMLAGGTQPG